MFSTELGKSELMEQTGLDVYRAGYFTRYHK